MLPINEIVCLKWEQNEDFQTNKNELATHILLLEEIPLKK